MSKGNKVPVQKGEINPAVKTMKTMTYKENLAERSSQLALLKDGQTLKYNEPKK